MSSHLIKKLQSQIEQLQKEKESLNSELKAAEKREPTIEGGFNKSTFVTEKITSKTRRVMDIISTIKALEKAIEEQKKVH